MVSKSKESLSSNRYFHSKLRPIDQDQSRLYLNLSHETIQHSHEEILPEFDDLIIPVLQPIESKIIMEKPESIHEQLASSEHRVVKQSITDLFREYENVTFIIKFDRSILSEESEETKEVIHKPVSLEHFEKCLCILDEALRTKLTVTGSMQEIPVIQQRKRRKFVTIAKGSYSPIDYSLLQTNQNFYKRITLTNISRQITVDRFIQFEESVKRIHYSKLAESPKEFGDHVGRDNEFPLNSKELKLRSKLSITSECDTDNLVEGMGIIKRNMSVSRSFDGTRNSGTEVRSNIICICNRNGSIRVYSTGKKTVVYQSKNIVIFK